jgi:hypothetical protein
MRVLLGLATALLAVAILAGPPARADEKKDSAESSASPYFALDPMPISIIRDGVGRGMLVVEVGIDAKTLDERKTAEYLMPRLTDLYIQVLNLYASRDLFLHHPPDAEVIDKRLQEATDEILGPGKGVVLLRQLLVRRKTS